MNKFVIVVGLIGLALPTFTYTKASQQAITKGTLDEFQVQLPQEECPTECFCDMVIFFATCTGDATKSHFPSLSWLNTDTRMRRVEIHDFVLGDLIIDSSTHYKLFRFVEELHLSHNQITLLHYLLTDTSVSASVAQNVEREREPSLLLLDLSFNNLSYFESIAEYRALKVLDLSHNFIHRLQLNGLEKLESLNLKSNDIQELSADIFQSLKSIQYINLDSNRLKKLAPNLFSNLPSLAHLILSSNPFQLDPTSLLLNGRTQFIDISNVGLDHVPAVMFGTVRDLRLNNNKLTRILDSDFESYPNVGLLVLDENQIEIIENDAFGRMDFLTSLWLNGNRLSSIPQNLPSSLSSLQLEENRISFLNASCFAPLHNLEHLNLHLNQITVLEPEVFSSLYNLVTLNLGTNRIDSIYRDSFKNLSKLTVLDLSGNPLKVVVNGAFTRVPQLQTLHLARINEKEIEFDAGLFDPLERLQSLDLSNSKNFSRQIIASNALARGWLKSLRELNIERCDLRIELSVLCTQLVELESLVSVRVQGNSFNTSTSASTSVMLGKVVTSTTKAAAKAAATNNSDNENDNLNSSPFWAYASSTPLQKLCPSASPAVTKIEDDQQKQANTSTSTGKGDETSLVDLDREKKVSLTLTAITTTKSPAASSSSTNVTISSMPSKPTSAATAKGTMTRSSSTSTSTSITRPTSNSTFASRTSITNTTTSIKTRGDADAPSTNTKKLNADTEGSLGPSPGASPAVVFPTATTAAVTPPTSSSTSSGPTSTSSYFGPSDTDTDALTLTLNKNRHQETNEDGGNGGALGPGSIDGFPADPSGASAGRTSSSSSISNTFGSGSRNSKSIQLQEHEREHNDDFAKGSFHGILPQKMYLAQPAAAAATAAAEEGSSHKSLIVKTIFISAGTCLLSVLLLLGFGLVLYRLNGGRFTRSVRTGARTREIASTSTSESYTRLEDKQELELGISNRMYYEGGQVYHIS